MDNHANTEPTPLKISHFEILPQDIKDAIHLPGEWTFITLVLTDTEQHKYVAPLAIHNIYAGGFIKSLNRAKSITPFAGEEGGQND